MLLNSVFLDLRWKTGYTKFFYTHDYYFKPDLWNLPIIILVLTQAISDLKYVLQPVFLSEFDVYNSFTATHLYHSNVFFRQA